MNSEQTSSPAARVSATAARQPLPSVAWFDVADPNSPALDELAARFDFHELQVEDCRHRPQRAKTEDHEGYVFTVVKHIHDARLLRFDDLDVFLGPDYIVTVHAHESAFIEKVRARAMQDHVERVDKIFYFLLDAVVDEYMPVLEAISDAISDIEVEVLQYPGPAILSQILALKRNLIEFRRITTMMREVVNALMRRERGFMGDDLDPYLRDVYDHLVRTVELVETYRDLLTGSLDIYLSAVANRTNEVMKVLTIWGTVALPLVIITGFFGMNLKLPWQETHHGTLLAVLLMIASTVSVLVYFRRKGWF